MGSEQVFISLKEVFPQIDVRVLRAVAVEHKKDADAAVVAVLEIIPLLEERSKSSTPLTASVISGGESSEALVDALATTQTMDSPPVNTVGSAEGQNGQNMNGDADRGHKELFVDVNNGHREGDGCTKELALSEEIIENSVQKKIDVYSHVEDVELANKDGVNTLQFEVSEKGETYETISGHKSPESIIKISSGDITAYNQNMDFIQENGDHDYFSTAFETAMNQESDQEKYWFESHNVIVGPPSLNVDDLKTAPVDNNVQLAVGSDVYGSDLEELGKILSNYTASNMETTNNVVGDEDESYLNASMTQSCQIGAMEVLEEVIADASNNKKTLLSAMESVISLRREVEVKEQAAEQAKVEASIGGADVLAKLEELKQTLQLTKESNSMHAGEVYGEKAVLATELRELQSRVLSLSDERDKSLVVLDEMRQTLEVRLAAAENEIKSAEQEKIEKEKTAMKALAEQELVMEKVVQESKVLKQQAEDNAKLQEFLVDRGRVVDMLQGEIAVICKDVLLLKENFNENVPFSKSLSSSQTSRIVSSSTSSSLKNLNPKESSSKSLSSSQTSRILSSSTSSSSKNLNPEESFPDGADSLMTQSQRDANLFFQEQWSEEEARRDDRKALVDDGWELCDDREIYA